MRLLEAFTVTSEAEEQNGHKRMRNYDDQGPISKQVFGNPIVFVVGRARSIIE